MDLRQFAQAVQRSMQKYHETMTEARVVLESELDAARDSLTGDNQPKEAEPMGKSYHA